MINLFIIPVFDQPNTILKDNYRKICDTTPLIRNLKEVKIQLITKFDVVFHFPNN